PAFARLAQFRQSSMRGRRHRRRNAFARGAAVGMRCAHPSIGEEAAMKATDFLKQQHREVEKLFAQVGKTEGADERRDLVEEIRSKLEVHTRIEEEIFYPAYRDGADTRKAEDAVLEAFEEHHVVKLVLGELTEIDCEAESFEAKMTVLEELVHHHV